jgi:hypothetical protein
MGARVDYLHMREDYDLSKTILFLSLIILSII